MINFIDSFFVVGDLYLLVSGLVVLITGIFVGARIVVRLMMIILVFGFFMQVDGFIWGVTDVLLLDGHWQVDRVGTFCGIVLIVVLFVVLGESMFLLKGGFKVSYEIFILMYYGMVALFMLIRCNDLLLLYICLELYSLCMYILVVMGRVSNLTVESGLKYFIMGVVSSGLVLLGIMLCYGSVGSLNYNDIEIFLSVVDSFQLVVGGFLLSMGLFVKMGIAPFHMWVPDVYEGSTTIITMYLVIIPKLGLFFLFMKLSVGVFYEIKVVLLPFFVLVAILSLCFGTIGGLFQDKIKRLMAYSSIANSGYLLILMLLMNNLGLFYFYLYIFIYALMILNVFTVMLSVVGYGSFRLVRVISRFSVLLKSRCFVGTSLTIGLLGLAGFPPFMGFFSKLCVFLIVLDGYNYLLFLLVVLASIVSAIYYLRVIRMLIFNRGKWGNLVGCSEFMGYVMGISTQMILLFPVYNKPFVYLCMMLVGIG
jgi:NADH-quinone oxidoreductase subunit N